MSNFDDMVNAFGKPNTERTGSLLGQLSAEERATVARFADWLKATTNMTDASVSSYRSYVAGAMIAFKAGQTREQLTSSQRSAVTKLAKFLASES